VHSVGPKPNLSQLCEPLQELKACLKQWVLRRRRNVCDEEQAQMPAGSEFHDTVAACRSLASPAMAPGN